MTTILKSFPSSLTPRDAQRDALLKLESCYKTSDVIVLNLPVASGKSAIAECVQAWLGAGEAVILTPTNILLEQYSKTSKLKCVFGKESVDCLSPDFSSCADRYQWGERQKKNGKKKTTLYCEGCPYATTERLIFYTKARFNYITNFFKYVSLKNKSVPIPGGRNPLGLKASRPVVIVDEAHTLIDFIKEQNTTHLWKHDFDYSIYRSREELVAALKNTVRITDTNIYQDLIDKLSENPPKYILKHAKSSYRGQSADRLEVTPVTTKGMKQSIFNHKTKLILMSATISPKDIEELGLADRRVTYISADSCIPAENRPVVFDPAAAVRGVDISTTAPIIADKIKQIAADYPDSKGLVHATYSQAKELRKYLTEDRFVFHGKDDKTAKYKSFRESSQPQVLIASGMYEGVDLPYDAGRFQVIAKVPFPNLGEPAVKYQADLDKDWYAWQTVKTVLQASGRICRTPEDYGATFIVDSNFKRLYQNNLEMFPKWYRDAVCGV
jgi:Rad3-related DNA helicase